ncbi:MAG: VCBS repeat-containing protein, partial [Bacteroidetes bacterium]|nr:VCBS repeat-containing protein [Bacteroidota bacterium]
MKNLILFIAVFFICFSLHSQQYEDFGFQRDLSVIVKDSLQNNLKNPWGGGLNSCQFAQIDMNMDGIKDLLVFDRSTNKIVTFINNGTPNTIDYTYAPEYRYKFPYMHDWVELVDYNGDGKEDIFTSSSAGISVYKNISDEINGLKFSLVTNMINSQQGTNYTNLLVTTVDYPAIADIDNDGDMDILAFFGFGSYVEYHRNMSMETYGIPDSLKYNLETYCWGKFAESQISNKLTLNITCPYHVKEMIDSINTLSSPLQIEHTGSTMLATDLNGDGLSDLLLGDVDYPGIIKLINGGSLSEANMVSQDTVFPSNTRKISLTSFPVPCFLDVDNDNKKDLIVSPFEGNQSLSENYKSCWFYKNIGTASSPVFEYQYNNFLQKDMIETGAGAYPILFDYDGDGLDDLFIGNYGILDSSYYSGGFLYSVLKSRITLYKNIGTTDTPAFQFITNDFANLAQLKLNAIVPAFGDIDGDGAAEMIIGRYNGTLDYYDNTAPYGSPMDMVLSQSDYMGINVGKYSAPQLVDLDKDSLIDLVIGEKNGNINFYKNTGSKTNPQFNLITDSLGGIDVTRHHLSNYGYSVPCFFKDSTDNFKLFLGSESGYIFYYKNIDNNLSGKFA